MVGEFHYHTTSIKEVLFQRFLPIENSNKKNDSGFQCVTCL